MFITSSKAGYTKDGEQFSHGQYFILASPTAQEFKLDLYACVKFVRLKQCGHFMMGQVKLEPKGEKRTVSGPFGKDGLPLWWEELTEAEQAQFVKVPDDIAEIYWHDNNHYETMMGYGKQLLEQKG